MKSKEARTGNSTYPKGRVSCSKDSFVGNQTFVFQFKFCAGRQFCAPKPARTQSPKPMCKSFRSAPTFAHRSADYIRSCVKAFSLSQKPSTHLRIGKIPSGKQAFRGNFANPRFVMRHFKMKHERK